MGISHHDTEIIRMSIFPQHPRLSIFQQHTTQLVKHIGGVGEAHRIVNKAARGNQSMGNLSSEPLCAFYSWCVVSSRDCCVSVFWKGSSLLHKDEGRICWSYGHFQETWSRSNLGQNLWTARLPFERAACCTQRLGLELHSNFQTYEEVKCLAIGHFDLPAT